jgi:hypothetical protein
VRVGIFVIVLCFLAAVMVAGKGISLAEEEAIGYVREIQRPAFVVRHGLRRTASIGYSVFMDDLFTTGKTGAMGITFKDNTMISITIAKLSPESVSVKTPVGTIGIRGTRFLVKIEENQQ